jgi:hypothetical protein
VEACKRDGKAHLGADTLTALTKLNEDWQGMPELHRHSGQAQ